MRLGVAGGGYVGLATATGLARQDHEVVVYETDESRAALLAAGRIPFEDASLSEAFAAEVASGRIAVRSDYRSGSQRFDFFFICVPTPQSDEGRLDTTYVFNAARSALAVSERPVSLVIRSTVNPGTTQALASELAAGSDDVQILMSPEFLQEGTALRDLEQPALVVIGGVEPVSSARLASLFEFTGAPVTFTDPTSAETLKLALNSTLALRVSMANEIARIALSVGADVETVLQGVGADPRIGPKYLRPGIGFGGSCLPKDLEAFRWSARSRGETPIVFDAAEAANHVGVDRICEALARISNGTMRSACVIGMAFKPGSDSIRQSLSVELVAALQARAVDVSVFDPKAEGNVRRVFDDSVTYVHSLEEISPDTVAIVIDAQLASTGGLRGHVVIDALGVVTMDQAENPTVEPAASFAPKRVPSSPPRR